MSSPPSSEVQVTRPDDRSQSPLVYILIFTSFALFALAIMSPRYQRRQVQVEQEFRGIEQIQRGRAEPGAPETPDEQPMLITLRPLMFSLATIMLIAWALLMWNRPSKTKQATEEDRQEQGK